jgi:hypothetical protein
MIHGKSVSDVLTATLGPVAVYDHVKVNLNVNGRACALPQLPSGWLVACGGSCSS